MPAIDRSLNMLSASANYTAGKWLTAEAQGSLRIGARGALKRGFDLEAGAEALVSLNASLRKFLAADAHGFATASAEVRGQIQTPIDLFDEAGIAVRLQAEAGAGAGVELAIGLVVGDFLDEVDADPRMKGAPARLVRVLLEEAVVAGGVRAQAALGAMAYFNLYATARLVASGDSKPGFTVAVEQGSGPVVGSGAKSYVVYGLDDSRNLVRRSIDIAVGSTLDELLIRIDDRPLAGKLAELEAPLRIAFRCCFEIGMELGANPGAFSAADGPKLALRAVQVALEEAQRAILERAVRWAGAALRLSIGSIAVSDRQWTKSLAARQALASHLKAIPVEPFDPTAANRDYWSRALDLAASVFVALGGFRTPDDPGAAPLATLYCATQLLFVGIERISSATARAFVLGIPPAVAAPAFSGEVAQPGDLLRAHINAAIGKRANAEITQASLVAFLVEGRILEEVVSAFPEIEVIVGTIVGGAPGALGDGLSVVFSNLGAFVPTPDGGVDAQASLAAILAGLRAYIDTRLRNDLLPALEPVIAGAAPEIGAYLDEVLLDSLDFAVDEVFTQLLDWSNGTDDRQTALREACSAILMRLFGRSLVVTADAILNRMLDGMSDAFRNVAEHVGDRGGIADFLAGPAPRTLSRDDIEELLTEQFLVMADAARPLDPGQRARIRGLLYEMIDFGAAKKGSPLSEQMLTDVGVKNMAAGIEVALELGRILMQRMADYTGAWVARVGQKIVAELGEVIDAVAAEVKEWLADLERFGRDQGRRSAALLDEIDRLMREIGARLDEALAAVTRTIGLLTARGAGRARLKAQLLESVEREARGVLRSLPGYGLVPGWAVRQVENALRDAIEGRLADVLLDPIVQALRGPVVAAPGLLGDLREMGPVDDPGEAVLDLVTDRIRQALTGAFGGVSPRIDLAVRFDARTRTQTPFGPVDLEFKVDFDLGSVRIPLDTVIDSARAAVRAPGAVRRAAEDAAVALAAALRAGKALKAAQAELDAVKARMAEAGRLIAQTPRGAPDAVIVSPGQASIIEGGLAVELRLPGVPLSYLGLGEDEVQRVYIWLNQEALPIAAFERRPLRRVRAGLDTPGTGLKLRLPPERLAEGINTLVVALADGRDGHRVERSVGFLALRPDAKLKAGRTRPARPVPAAGDTAYSVLATGRGPSGAGSSTAAAGLKPGNRSVALLAKLAADRKKRVEAEKLRVTAALQAARAAWKTLGHAVVAGPLPAAAPGPTAATPPGLVPGRVRTVRPTPRRPRR